MRERERERKKRKRKEGGLCKEEARDDTIALQK
jgi:hypothetical protein